MSRVPSDCWIALVVLLSCGVFLSDLWDADASGVFVKTTTLPIALVFVLMGLSVILLVGSLLRGLPAAASDPAFEPVSLSLIALVLWIILYVILLPIAGYLVASMIFMVGASLLYGNRRWQVILPWAVILPTGLQLFFEKVMIILLPASRLLG